jgi:broad specificity phosphatase PhoE
MSTTESIRVLLFRAGQTQWEVAGRIGGSSDVPLAEVGKNHVRSCIEQLHGVKLSTIYCGPDEASRATAEQLAKACGGKVRVVDDLAEIHLGLWEGIAESELGDRCPKAYRQWLEDPTSVLVPEGETINDVQGRVLEVLARTFEKAKPSSDPIGVVLRPVTLGIVCCALDGSSCKSIWHKTRNGYMPQWKTITRQTTQLVRELAEGPSRR